MKIYERICMEGKLVGFKYTTEDKTEVVQTHTATYLQMRNEFKKMGDVMGLDKLLRDLK